MKTSTVFLALTLIATAASAQQNPDYSRPTLLRVFADTQVEANDVPPIRFGGGAVSFTALGTRWAFLYTPMLPLAGSRPVVSQIWPDAFSLTGTEIARLPRDVVTPRSEELLRIERSDRSRARVTVRAGSQ